jgi:superoxide dismutase, Fe-Mn family
MKTSRSNTQDQRRRLLVAAAVAGAGMAMAAGGARAAAKSAVRGRSPLTQPALPFAPNALEPVISEKTIGFHYGKHHKAYFDNLAKLVAGGPLEHASLEEIIVHASGDKALAGMFNNAAQAWNHNFYWASLSDKPQAPSGALAAAINRDFGSLDNLNKQLIAASVGQFGSGWGWLVVENGTLKVVSTSNADIPFLHDQTPLLTIDVWEHAYYLDAQNRRADYVAAVVGKLLNWTFAAQNYASALSPGAA